MTPAMTSMICDQVNPRTAPRVDRGGNWNFAISSLSVL
jgi:hypothetical protein